MLVYQRVHELWGFICSIILLIGHPPSFTSPFSIHCWWRFLLLWGAYEFNGIGIGYQVRLWVQFLIPLFSVAKMRPTNTRDHPNSLRYAANGLPKEVRVKIGGHKNQMDRRVKVCQMWELMVASPVKRLNILYVFDGRVKDQRSPSVNLAQTFSRLCGVSLALDDAPKKGL